MIVKQPAVTDGTGVNDELLRPRTRVRAGVEKCQQNLSHLSPLSSESRGLR